MVASAEHQTLEGRILELARSGSEVHFEKIVQRHEAMVFSIALRFFGERSAAEDVAQDVFLQLYRRMDEIEDEEHLLRWLRKVTSNRCIDLRRRVRPVTHESLDEHPAPSSAGDPMLRRTLRNLLGHLSDQQRIIITLRYQEELAVEEISETLEMPTNTVKSHLRRGLLALREQLGRSKRRVGSALNIGRVSL